MTAFDAILTALNTAGVKVTAGRDSARAQCPGHGSNGLTLAVRRDAGRVLLHCHAGCDAGDVLALLGLGLRDLYDDDLPRGYVPPPRREVTPWEAAMSELGIRNPPPVEHVLGRMVRDQTPDADGATFEQRRARDIAEARAGDRAAAAGGGASW